MIRWHVGVEVPQQQRLEASELFSMASAGFSSAGASRRRLSFAAVARWAWGPTKAGGAQVHWGETYSRREHFSLNNGTTNPIYTDVGPRILKLQHVTLPEVNVNPQKWT